MPLIANAMCRLRGVAVRFIMMNVLMLRVVILNARKSERWYTNVSMTENEK